MSTDDARRTQAAVHPNHAYAAWVVGVPWQGKGFATEAAAAVVRWLIDFGIPEVRACVHPEHTASRHVARNAGLHRTNLIEDDEEVWVRRAPCSRPRRSGWKSNV